MVQDAKSVKKKLGFLSENNAQEKLLHTKKRKKKTSLKQDNEHQAFSIDFSKAFHIVTHQVFVTQAAFICQNYIEKCHSYLIGRSQFL
jgi:hypothetical protein